MADEAKEISRGHMKWMLELLKEKGGKCTYEDIVVVGEKQDSSSKFLLKQARQRYVPGKLVRVLDPHVDTLSIGDITFPQSEIAQAFVCTDKLCSSPIQNAEE